MSDQPRGRRLGCFPPMNASVPHNRLDEIRHNHRQLKQLGTPITRLDAEYSGSQAEAMVVPHDVTGSNDCIYLAKGAKVRLTVNVGIHFGLSNGAVGVVQIVVYERGTTAPALPAYVLVDFGDQYLGETFFRGMPDRDGWVPVYHETAAVSDENPGCSRTMIPLKLAYARTVWGAQGQTYYVDGANPSCQRRGRNNGSAFARSRGTNDRADPETCSDIDFIDFVRYTFNRIREEERLRRLAAATLDRWREQQANEPYL